MLRLTDIKKSHNVFRSKFFKFLDILRYFNGYAFFSPFYVEIILTYQCNLNCSYCYQRRTKKYDDLTLAGAMEIEKNIRNSFALKPHIYLSGGEPTENNDFIGIVKYFVDKNYMVSIATNGSDIENNLSELSNIKNIKNIIISLHTNSFDKLKKVFDRINGLKKDIAMKISLNCPIDMLVDKKLSIKEILNDFNYDFVDYICFLHPRKIFNDSNKKDYSDFINDFTSLNIKDLNSKVLFLPYIRKDKLESYYDDSNCQKINIKCILPWFDLVIRPNGEVIPCDELNVVMGNINNDLLKYIWNSSVYRDFRKNIYQNKLLHDVCLKCCHRQY